MILSNTEGVPGRTIREFYGVVTGSTVRAKHVGRDFMASLKNLVGGELKGYTELLHEARQEALDRMSEQAKSVGANAVSCSSGTVRMSRTRVRVHPIPPAPMIDTVGMCLEGVPEPARGDSRPPFFIQNV